MNSHNLIELVQAIVTKAQALKNRHTTEVNAPVNYACIFAQSDEEYEELNKAAQTIGQVVKKMSSGLLYHITDLATTAGTLRILKIRVPDPTRPETGDADFTVDNYPTFKQTHLSQPGFKLITRPEMEMLELMEANCPVRAYFSYPPVDKQILGF